MSGANPMTCEVQRAAAATPRRVGLRRMAGARNGVRDAGQPRKLIDDSEPIKLLNLMADGP